MPISQRRRGVAVLSTSKRQGTRRRNVSNKYLPKRRPQRRTRVLSSDASSGDISLSNLGLPPLPVTLRRHQQKLVARIVRERKNVLFIAGTGSGKTISAIVSGLGLLVSGDIDGVHIVTPKSVRGQFEAEVQRIVPATWSSAFVLTTHAMYFNANEWPYTNTARKLLVIDEAHSAMATTIHLTPHTQEPRDGKMAFYAIEAARKAERVLLLTATPLKNSPTELFNLLAAVRQVSHTEFTQWVQPWRKVMLRQYKAFVRKGSKQALAKTNQTLGLYAQQIAPVLQFARTSREGFPKQIDLPVHLIMDPTYLKLYNAAEADETEAFVQELQKREAKRQATKVKGRTQKRTSAAPLQYLFDPNSVNAFYSKLRQAVNGYTKDVVSSKIEYTVKTLAACHRKGRRALAYSHFLNGGLHLVERKLREEYHVPYASIIGSTSAVDRQRYVKEMNDDSNDLHILLISEAGSEGLDLKGIRDVILLEPHFHEAVAHQVIGRAVRYESHAKLPPDERDVTVHRVLLSKPTTTGRRWEEVEARNDTKLRQLVDTYAHLVHADGPAHTSVELTLNTAARDAVHSALDLADLPNTTFVYHDTLEPSDWRVLVVVRGGLDFFRADDDYDDVVTLEPPPTDLSVDDILDRMASRKQQLVDAHLQLLRRTARRVR